MAAATARAALGRREGHSSIRPRGTLCISSVLLFHQKKKYGKMRSTVVDVVSDGLADGICSASIDG